MKITTAHDKELSVFRNFIETIENTMIIEDLINADMPGISVAKAQFLSECAISCLSRQRHCSGVQMVCSGIVTTPESLQWTSPFTDQVDRSTNDLQEATEYGAECISALFALEHTPYTIIKRSRKGTGVDYWLGMKNNPLFNAAARLEVSGIFGNKGDIQTRKRQKLQQSSASDSTMLPAYISIVEFSTPAIVFEKK